MKERPIIFSGPMVRAILEGRKTQTRRVVKPQPSEYFRPSPVEIYSPISTDKDGFEEPGPEIFGCYDKNGENEGYKCPYSTSDRLWVKETFSEDFRAHYPCDPIWFRADRPWIDKELETRDGVRGLWSPESRVHVPFRWRPSIFMPRWASRITLEVVSVRVERVQEISEENAIAEGTGHGFVMNGGWPDYQHIRNRMCELTQDSARMSYSTLWDSLNAKRGFGWEANPWVWVIEFRAMTAPILCKVGKVG